LPKPDEALQQLEAVTRTRECLTNLDERSRKLIELKFDEGLSYKEISEKMELSVSNVGYILHAALKQLAAELKQKGVEL
jgi:RNA polymerase sigma-70 factor (ECF subfamily)